VNAVFRVGDDLSVRLPRSEQIQDWDVDCGLAALTGKLPLAIPEVLGTGEPAEGYPCRWSVHTWVEGEPWRIDRVDDPAAAAVRLGAFLQALHAVDPAALPCPPLLTGHVHPLAQSDRGVRARAARLSGADRDALLRVWEGVVHTPEWHRAPVLIHWDLLPGNVIVRDGRLAGVIDWGALTVGDPARDLVAAWTLLPRGAARTVFRSSLDYDDNTWTRARGWAFTCGGSVAAEALADPVPDADAAALRGL
jgi:aminoglycoside phosphotransferase (APT) family kinase protein